MHFQTGAVKFGISAVLSLLAPLAAAGEHSPQGGLEEILVTATKRAESTQEIPMSLEVVSGDYLDAYRITGFDDLSANTPNFTVAEGITQNNVVMRGLGSLGERGFEMPVALFIDEVYSPRSRQYRMPLMDAERVEILRGPQAVLFGLNSTAGAVNVTSRSNMPGDPLHIEVHAGFEAEHSGWFAGFAAGGGVTDTLGIRLAYEHFDTGDGFYKNTVTGATENAKTQDALRLSLVWTAADKLTITAKFAAAEYDIKDGSFGEIVNGIASALEPTDGVANWKTSADTYLSERSLHPPGGSSEFSSATLKFDYDLEGHILTGIASYSDFYYVLATDIDMTVGGLVKGSSFPIGVWASAGTDYQQKSAELRLASDAGQTLEYIAGVYFQDGDYYEPTDNGSEALTLAGGPASPLAPFFNTRTGGAVQQDSTLWSAYAALTWNVSNDFRLTGGLRYTDEEKDAVRTGFCFGDAGGGSFIPLPHGVGALNCPTIDFAEASLDFSEAMPELAAQYDLNEDIMVYAKVGRTYKSGGFATANSATPDTFSYLPEEATGFEAGLRSRFAENRVELNISLFDTEYDDLQVNSFQTDNMGNTIASVNNAGSASSSGVEVDALWAVTDWLQLGASAAVLNGEYDDFQQGPCGRTEGAANGGSTICDFSGRQLPFAADGSANFSADLDYPIGAQLRLLAGMAISYSDGYFTDTTLESELRQDSYTKLAARIGVADANDQWEVVLSGLNLSNEKVITSANILFGYDIVYLGAPRTITLQGKYRFGAH